MKKDYYKIRGKISVITREEVLRMQEELRQTTEDGQVKILTATGTELTFSNGGVDGEFEIIITDQRPVPALFVEVGRLAPGKYRIKGNYAGRDYREVELDGAYTVYGNPANGNVMILKN